MFDFTSCKSIVVIIIITNNEIVIIQYQQNQVLLSPSLMQATSANPSLTMLTRCDIPACCCNKC